MTHTPTPWEIWKKPSESNPSVVIAQKEGNKFITQTVGGNDEANAAFIVKAVNEREELLNLLRGMTTLTKLKYGNLDKDVFLLIEKAENFIKKAEEDE
jgi:hypothetical protein